MRCEDLDDLPRDSYGDSPEMADEILALVLSGEMTASCMALRNVGKRAPMPAVGARAIVLNGAGEPAALIETTEVRVGPISSVDMEFVIAEGEGFTTIDAWLDRHATYFERTGGYSPDMDVVFERFRLIRVLKDSGT
jgi:uncharacterized protein YhfF